MKKTKTKCYLYTRVSTSMQVDGYSLDAQRDKLRKYAEYEDMVVAGEYSDEGFSGKNIQGRHEFQRMLQDIQDCKDGVEYVLVFKLSRFGRNAADVLNNVQIMQDFVSILSVWKMGLIPPVLPEKSSFLFWPVSPSWSVKTSRHRRWPDVGRRPVKANGTAVKLHMAIGSRMVCLSLKNPKPPSFG